jgi:hypothetical protein
LVNAKKDDPKESVPRENVENLVRSTRESSGCPLSANFYS